MKHKKIYIPQIVGVLIPVKMSNFMTCNQHKRSGSSLQQHSTFKKNEKVHWTIQLYFNNYRSFPVPLALPEVNFRKLIPAQFSLFQTTNSVKYTVSALFYIPPKHIVKRKKKTATKESKFTSWKTQHLGYKRELEEGYKKEQ